MAKIKRKRSDDFEIGLLLRGVPLSIWFDNQQFQRHAPDHVGCVRSHFVSLVVFRSEDQMEKLLAEKDPETLVQKTNIERTKHAGGYGAFVYPENWHDIYKDLVDLGKKR